MELRNKQKIVKVIGAAEESLCTLEENIHAYQAEGKTPPKEDTQLLKSIGRALDTLKIRPFAGNPVSKHLWPSGFSHLPNLFRMEISQFWRILYYVVGDDVKVVSVVFEICDHKKYDRIFGYRKK